MVAILVVVAGCGPRGEPSWPPRERTPPAGALRIGQSGELLIARTAADGSWVLFAQARSDIDGDGVVHLWTDRPRYYFVRAGREAEFDGWVGGGERWLLMARAGELVLVDGRDGGQRVLGRAPGEEPWYAGWIAAGEARMVYLRAGSAGAELVERELGSGDERVLADLPDGHPYPVLDDAGEWLTLIDLGDDALIARWTRQERCHPPLGEAGRQRFDTSFLHLPSGRWVRDQAALAPWGSDAVLARRGATVAVDGLDGRLRPLVPPACAPRVVCVQSRQRFVVLACDGPLAGQPVVATYREGRPPVALPLPPPNKFVSWSPLGDRMAAVRRALDDEAPLSVVDLPSGRVHRLPERSELVWSQGTRYAMLTGDGDLVVVDLSSGARRRLARGMRGGAAARRDGVVASHPLVVDVVHERVLGRFRGDPVGVAASGRLLFARRKLESWGTVLGPLWWEWPAR